LTRKRSAVRNRPGLPFSFLFSSRRFPLESLTFTFLFLHLCLYALLHCSSPKPPHTYTLETSPGQGIFLFDAGLSGIAILIGHAKFSLLRRQRRIRGRFMVFILAGVGLDTNTAVIVGRHYAPLALIHVTIYVCSAFFSKRVLTEDQRQNKE
jgi:hypothetical protein